MHRHVAVDPELVGAEWSRWRDVVRAQFGAVNGRWIADFPEKEWKQRVRDAAKAAKEAGKLKRVKFDTIINDLQKENFLVPCNEVFRSEDISWIEAARETQREDHHWDAVLTTEVEDLAARIYSFENVEYTQTGLELPRTLVAKTEAGLLEFVSSLLQYSAQVRFVDPNFKPGEPRFQEVTHSLLNQAYEGVKPKRCEYHLEDKMGPKEFKDNLYAFFHGEVPPTTFVRWKRIEPKDKAESMHSRYILTERGGVGIDFGLDAEPEVETDQTTDVHRIDFALRTERWNQFCPQKGTFEFVDAWIVDDKGVKQADRHKNKFRVVN